MTVAARCRLAAGLFAAVLGFCALVSPAAALTEEEAGKVTRLLGELQPELGGLAYDEEAADDWFDRDQESEGRIEKAGFSREGWKEALDATFRGYLATIPEAEFEDRFANIEARLEASSTLTAEQKAAMREMFEEERAKTRALRAEGRQYLDIIRPHADLLDAALGEPSP